MPNRIAAMAVVILVVSLAIALSDAASVSLFARRSNTTGPKDLCDSKVYCEGPLLDTVQRAEIFNDSKTFVDLYQLHDPDITLDNFDALMKATNNSPNRTQVAAFVAENFAMHDELSNATLPDWQAEPEILNSIQDPKYREWAKDLNFVWKKLARKINIDVTKNPQRYSLINVPHDIVVPGGRFKEFYYWDSYWIIEGLLLCGMNLTAKGMIENFLSMVEKYGFVPNGGRIYYLSRSQPPLLIPMVVLYYEFTKDQKFLKENILLLEKEFEYWHNEKTVNVMKNSKKYRMARYVVNSRGPRPESYKEDYQLAQQIPEQKRGALYNDLKAAAESGWDFSYRWCIATTENATINLINVSTSDIIPVDLNAMLERNAKMLASIYNILGNYEKVRIYNKIAQEYQAAIDSVLWNEDEGVWLDYDVRNKQHRNAFYPSNLTPLYTMSYNLSKQTYYASQAVLYLKKNKADIYLGGTPSSSDYTGEQWDFPNAWPPLQSILVMGLYQTGVKEAVDMAIVLASRWLKSNYLGFQEYGKMFEKYDAIVPGKSGGGGEYNVQDGFGWTNGIAFEFFHLFPFIKSEVARYDNGNVSR